MTIRTLLVAAASASACLALLATAVPSLASAAPPPRGGAPGLVPSPAAAPAPRFEQGTVALRGVCLPDIEVRHVVYIPGADLYSARIENVGCAYTGPFSVRLADGLHRFWTLGPGGQVDLYAPCPAGEQVTVVVDVLDEVAESQEWPNGAAIFCLP